MVTPLEESDWRQRTIETTVVDNSGVMFCHRTLANVVIMVLVATLLVVVGLVVVGDGMNRVRVFVVYLVEIELELEFGFPDRVVD